MFRIEGFCEDKYLARVMRAMAGMTHDMRFVPVVNAEIKKGKVQANGSGNLAQMFADYMRKKKIEKVNPPIARDFLASVGRSPGSSSYLLKEARKAGVLRKSGKDYVPVTAGGKK